jgi:hypothetical protein
MIEYPANLNSDATYLVGAGLVIGDVAMESKLCCLLQGWTCSGCDKNYGCRVCNPRAWSEYSDKSFFTYLCDDGLADFGQGCWPKFASTKYYKDAQEGDNDFDAAVKDWLKNREQVVK